MNKTGRTPAGGNQLKVGEFEEPLQERALREIERSLQGKLKAHRVSDGFIERCGEDAIQRGVLDYLRAREAGKEVESRNAFIVHAAFHRAIQELRREARQADGAVAEALLASGRNAAPPSEELALEHLQAQELHAAIEELPSDVRQLLALHYFEQLSAKRAAKLLYYSEATYRRRLRRALAALAARLGVAAPDPGSELALEVGLAAWAGLGGARVALGRGPLEQLAGLVDRAREGLAWASARLRDPLARADASGATEQVGAVATGPAGKVLGGCAAAIACVVGGAVVGPGIAAHGEAPPQRVAPRAAVSKAAAQKERPVVPAARESTAAVQTQPSSKQTSPPSQTKPRSTERQRVEEQTSGIARAASESASPAEAEASTAETEAVAVTPSSSGESSSDAARSEFGFEGQP